MNVPNPRDLDPVRLARGPIEIGVTPANGANLVSLQFQGRELIHFDHQLIPTGGTRSVDGTPLDFRSLRPLGDQTPDHIYWKRHRDATAELYPSGQGVRVVLSASPDFTHMILYAPPDAPLAN